MAMNALTTRPTDERATVELVLQTTLGYRITEDVPVVNVESWFPEYGVMRRAWFKALRKQHPAAQAAASRIHNRMHRFLGLLASQGAVVLVADGNCGDHAAVIVGKSKGLFATLMESGVCFTKFMDSGELQHQVNQVAPGEWYKGYQVAPDGEDAARWW